MADPTDPNWGAEPENAAPVTDPNWGVSTKDKGTVIYKNSPSAAPVAGTVLGLATSGASYAPEMLHGVQSLATPENLGYLSTAVGLAKAYQDLSDGHPISAAEHAILGAAPSGLIKVLKIIAPAATKAARTAAQSTIEYAKQAGENIVPSNVVANPTVGGAVDNYAASMGQRVVRILGPNGEVVSAPSAAAPTVAEKAGSLFAKVAPWLKGAGAAMSSMSAEADALLQLNTPDSIAQLASKMNPPGQHKLLQAYKGQPEYVSAITQAIK